MCEIGRSTKWHCGGHVMTDHFERFEHANLFVKRDGNSFSAGHLGVAAMTLRPASGTGSCAAELMSTGG